MLDMIFLHQYGTIILTFKNAMEYRLKNPERLDGVEKYVKKYLPDEIYKNCHTHLDKKKLHSQAIASAYLTRILYSFLYEFIEGVKKLKLLNHESELQAILNKKLRSDDAGTKYDDELLPESNILYYDLLRELRNGTFHFRTYYKLAKKKNTSKFESESSSLFPDPCVESFFRAKGSSDWVCEIYGEIKKFIDELPPKIHQEFKKNEQGIDKKNFEGN